MDWIGIVVFIVFMIIRALSESEKQKKQRQARQQGRPPVARPPMARPPVAEPPRTPVSREALPPIAGSPLPPIFSFPFFEETREREPRVDPPTKVEKAKPVSPPRPAPRRALSETLPKTVVHRRQAPVGLELSQAAQGVIWSEILQAPRGIRPYRPKGMGKPY